ncbi:MAG: RNA polymerase sigma factor [Eubacterium sp.]|nr:RNA polymerase sigma factor [Eubacterium sp.]MCM1214425.1 RNA polymerase sigma factor [Lachnospiraceae bacterium]MCM1238715.1 RNA polymerase sigma factor [Lachnospiraceae bacterium]MCM1342624.1 RNA polymerase sigma factor [Muribaculaceae bacterium]MCM1409744.1 RNA polymerase sigma factor [Lachnospiraceae bacterium]
MTKQELTDCIDTYGRELYSFCRHLTGNAQEADELYQDTWLKTMELLEDIDPMGNVKSYCLSVALRLWKNRKRKFAWRKRIAGTQDILDEEGLEYISDGSPTSEERVLEKERDRMVWNAVDALPEKLRTVILLYYMEELSVSQIAAAAGVPEGTVKSRLYHARKILEQKLEGVYYEK